MALLWVVPPGGGVWGTDANTAINSCFHVIIAKGGDVLQLTGDYLLAGFPEARLADCLACALEIARIDALVDSGNLPAPALLSDSPASSVSSFFYGERAPTHGAGSPTGLGAASFGALPQPSLLLAPPGAIPNGSQSSLAMPSPGHGGAHLSTAAARSWATIPDYDSTPKVQGLRCAVHLGTVTITLLSATAHWNVVFSAQAATEELARISTHALDRQVVCSLDAWGRIQNQCQIFGTPQVHNRLYVVRSISSEPLDSPQTIQSGASNSDPIITPSEVPGDRNLSLLTNFVPSPAIFRLSGVVFETRGRFLGEVRKCTTVSIHIAATAAQIFKIYECIMTVVTRTNGCVVRIRAVADGYLMTVCYGLPPLVRPEYTVDAINAALEIPKSLEEDDQVMVSIGISTGKAHTDVVGDESGRLEFVVLGEPIVLSERLMQAARSDCLCDRTTSEVAPGVFRFEQLPARKVKGRTERIDVFRPVPDAGRAASITGDTSTRYASRVYQSQDVIPTTMLIGREAEKRFLLKDVLCSQERLVVLVRGAAGLGKSALLDLFGESAARAGRFVVTGEGYPGDRATAYYVWRTLLPLVLGLRGLSEDSQRRDHLTDLAKRAATAPAPAIHSPHSQSAHDLRLILYPTTEESAPGSHNETPPRSFRDGMLPTIHSARMLPAVGDEASLVRLLPVVNDVLGRRLFAETPYTRSLSVLQRSQEVLVLILALLSQQAKDMSQVSRKGRMVIIIENLHFLDSRSLELLRGVVDHTSIDVIASTRPVDPHSVLGTWLARLARHPDYESLDLRPMQPDDVAQLACSLVGSATMSDRLQSLIVEQGQGNPFFIKELIFHLQASKTITIHNWEADLPPSSDLEHIRAQIPERVESMVTSRIDQLPNDAVLCLKVGAILGIEFALHDLCQVHPLRPSLDEAKTALQAPCEHGIIVCVDNGATDTGGMNSLSSFQSGSHRGTALDESGPRYRFLHSITRDVSLSLLPQAQRVALHKDTLTFLESLTEAEHKTLYPKMAQHAAQAGIKQTAVDYYEKAAETAESFNAMREVIVFLRAALSLTEVSKAGVTQARVATWYSMLGRACRRLGLHQSAYNYQAAALAHLGVEIPDMEGVVMRSMMRRMIFQQLLGSALPCCAPRLEITPQMGRILTQLVESAFLTIKTREAAYAILLAVQWTQSVKGPPTGAALRAWMSAAILHTRWPWMSERYYGRAWRVVERHPERYTDEFPHLFMLSGIYNRMRGDLARSQSQFVTAWEYATLESEPLVQAEALGLACECSIASGNLESSLDLLGTGRQEAAVNGDASAVIAMSAMVFIVWQRFGPDAVQLPEREMAWEASRNAARITGDNKGVLDRVLFLYMRLLFLDDENNTIRTQQRLEALLKDTQLFLPIFAWVVAGLLASFLHRGDTLVLERDDYIVRSRAVLDNLRSFRAQCPSVVPLLERMHGYVEAADYDWSAAKRTIPTQDKSFGHFAAAYDAATKIGMTFEAAIAQAELERRFGKSKRWETWAAQTKPKPAEEVLGLRLLERIKSRRANL